MTVRPDRLYNPIKTRNPTIWAVWNDLFHKDVPERFIDQALEVMGACPQHTFLVLTKRAHLAEPKLYEATLDNPIRELGGGDYVPNLWLGVTVCNQQEADEKIPLLLQTTAAHRWISIEPMLGPVDLQRSIGLYYDAHGCNLRGPDWVVGGGETGAGARPMHPDWARSVRDQCRAAGVPFWFKSWGSWTPYDQSTDEDRMKANRSRATLAGDGSVPAVAYSLKCTSRFLDGEEWNGRPEGMTP